MVRRSIRSSREALRARGKLASSDVRDADEQLEGVFGSYFTDAPQLARYLMCAALVEDWAEIRETGEGKRMVFKRVGDGTKWVSAWRTARGNKETKRKAFDEFPWRLMEEDDAAGNRLKGRVEQQIKTFIGPPPGGVGTKGKVSGLGTT